MKIEIAATSGPQRTDKFKADLKDLPGSPPLGFGATEAEAVASLFCTLILDRDYQEYLPKLAATVVVVEHV